MVRKGTCQSEKVSNLTENEQCSEKYLQKSHVGDISNDHKRDEKSLRAPREKLGDLTESQQKIAMKMMTEQSFAQNDDDDVGCIEGLQLNLELSDTSPFQTTYTSIPRPMYVEVKALH